MIEGSEVQAFFNFLLNCSSCTAMSGTQAGLPPTILSPKPFKGATLKNLKVRRGAPLYSLTCEYLLNNFCFVSIFNEGAI